MSLQTVVKAGSISNLTDARYCAGMGVEIIGFSVGKTGSAALEPSKIKEIAGWLSGVKIAVELDKNDFDESFILDIIQNLNPDYLQIPEKYAKKLKEITPIPLLIETNILSGNLAQGDFFLYTGSFEDEKALKEFCQTNSVILSGMAIQASNLLDLLAKIHPYGIELKGGTEISPGLKNSDDLSDMLELLEVEE